MYCLNLFKIWQGRHDVPNTELTEVKEWGGDWSTNTASCSSSPATAATSDFRFLARNSGIVLGFFSFVTVFLLLAVLFLSTDVSFMWVLIFATVSEHLNGFLLQSVSPWSSSTPESASKEYIKQTCLSFWLLFFCIHIFKYGYFSSDVKKWDLHTMIITNFNTYTNCSI